MASIERYEDLHIWRRAIEIAVKVYFLSEQGRLKNDFGQKINSKGLLPLSQIISRKDLNTIIIKTLSDFLNILKVPVGS